MGLVTLTLNSVELVVHGVKELLHLVDGRLLNLLSFIIFDSAGTDAG